MNKNTLHKLAKQAFLTNNYNPIHDFFFQPLRQVHHSRMFLMSSNSLQTASWKEFLSFSPRALEVPDLNWSDSNFFNGSKTGFERSIARQSCLTCPDQSWCSLWASVWNQMSNSVHGSKKNNKWSWYLGLIWEGHEALGERRERLGGK